jgi:hypothetical protein
MGRILGYILYLLALAITVLVIGAKYKLFQIVPISGILDKDHAQFLLIALFLSLVSRWL